MNTMKIAVVKNDQIISMHRSINTAVKKAKKVKGYVVYACGYPENTHKYKTQDGDQIYALPENHPTHDNITVSGLGEKKW